MLRIGVESFSSGSSVVRERAVEKFLREEVEAIGGICEKHVTPGRRGAPDRLITWPFIPMELVETKAPKGVVKAHQVRDHVRRKRLGVTVYVCYTKEDVSRYILGAMDRIEKALEARGQKRVVH